VEQVAKDVDLILVVGSPIAPFNRLVEVAQRSGVRAQLIDSRAGYRRQVARRR